MSETPDTGAADQHRLGEETRAPSSTAAVAIGVLSQKVASLPAAKAKRLILRLKLRGEITLEEAQALFDARPELRSA